MEIKLKFHDELAINNILKEIINTQDIDISLKFKLLGIMKSLESDILNYNTIRNDKILEYGKESDDGNIEINSDDKDSIQKFNNDMNKILNSDVVVTIQKIKASDLFNLNIPIEYLLGLYPIMEE